MEVVVSLDHLASQEREVRRENLVLQGCLCQVPQDVQGLPVFRVNLAFQDLQAFQQDRTVSLESLGAQVYREREASQERRVRKVRNSEQLAIIF